MLRGIHSIIPTDGTRSILLVAILALPVLLNGQVNAEGATDEQELSHPPIMLVDNKYWTKNTEFGERANWRHLIRPCTLMERIKMGEHLVVSMGSSLDGVLESGALESNIKDLQLPNDGVLLLEEDTLDDPMDPLFVKYLNNSGDCLDSDLSSLHDGAAQLFEFEPHSDDMSWFNPDNWASTYAADGIIDWIPDSHRIPCSEDAAIFGSRQWSLGATLESEERASVLSFKVNFRPSQFSLQEESDILNASIHNLRVSKLKIGSQTFSQKGLDLLLSSQDYENNLFQLNDTLGLLRQEPNYRTDSYQTLLTIDESSVRPNQVLDACIDEAGCLCGNEDTNVMRAICSFNEPLKESDFPCRDPIASPGYCNKICATSILILMDPVRFSETFVNDVIHKLMTSRDQEDYFAAHVFIGARRTAGNRYEITFRLVPGEGADSYESVLGREREFAELVYKTLDNAATRSFYGIKFMTRKSSTDWRRQNRQLVFMLSCLVFIALVTMAIVYIDSRQLSTRHAATFESSWLTALSRFRPGSRLSDPGHDGGEDLADLSEGSCNLIRNFDGA